MTSRIPMLLCDLDGTLFHMGDRHPYDADLCGLDTVNVPVLQTVRALSALGWATGLASGRGYHSSHRYYTEQSLFWNGIAYDELWMRAAHDARPDYEVKREIYLRDIEPFYDVKIVLDDRMSVVSMWRELGLTCFQVAPGPDN